MSQIYKVDILGSEYTLRGDLDPELLERVTELLHQKIKEVQTAMPSASKLHVAVLTALNMAYDCLEAKEELDQMEKLVETKSHHWISKLDSCRS